MPTIDELVEIIEMEGPKIKLWNYVLIVMAALTVNIIIQHSKEPYSRGISRPTQFKRQKRRTRSQLSPISY